MASNYQDVLDQLQAAGLQVTTLQVGRLVRCKVEGDREKRGWYVLHEITAGNGDLLLVGSYGVWHGNDSGSQKIELRKATDSLGKEQREAIRRRLQEDRKKADQARAREADRAAAVAAKAWAACAVDGDSDYLAQKGVGAHGIRFSPSGAIAIPLLDTAGRVHGLQIIRSKRAAKAEHKPAKEFWPAGVAKRGHFHLLGGVPNHLLLLAEGYATAATLYEATGLPVATAFDAGNLAAVAAALHKRYKRARILICADDDNFASCRQCKARLVLTETAATCRNCGQPHKAVNTGITAASTAALEVGGQWIRPVFDDEAARHRAFLEKGAKATDFNDLHLAEGLHSVRVQIEARLAALGWNVAPGRAPTTTGGAGGALRPIESLDEMLERFALVFGQGGMVFDRQEHCLISLSDMRDICVSRELHRAWAEHPDRSIVRVSEVGFDPGNEDPGITCNLWAGWPTTPKAGRCEKLLELLRYMCSEEPSGDALYTWILRWVAYPIQNPGAKMKTTVVVHGPQGTGKNMFFEAVMTIYGRYGRMIDQSAIEDRFNDYASRKLFLVADEVVARSDLFHVKNRLKAFITGEWIRINPKNMAAYDERNHVNVVFLSNESMPVVLEEDDRRHAVVWTPVKLGADFYRQVLDEIHSGGIEALHDHLLHLDLGDFGPGTLPPLSAAKAELINLSLDSTSRFLYELEAGDIAGVTPRPCLNVDLYELYKAWCHRNGMRAAPLPKLVNVLGRKHRIPTSRKRYQTGTGRTDGPHGVSMFGPEREPPPGASEQIWLGTHISAFSLAVRDFKEAGRG